MNAMGLESRRAQRNLLRLRRVLVFALATLAVHLERGILLVERERDGDELVLVAAVAVVARHYNTRIANTHLGPSTLGDSVDAEQTVAPVQGENGEEVQEEGGCRGGRDSPSKGSQYLENAKETRHTRQGRQRTPSGAPCHRRPSKSSERPCSRRRRCP